MSDQQKIRMVKKCPDCGGQNLRFDAWALWDADAEQMVLYDWFTHDSGGYCTDCDSTLCDFPESVEEEV